MMGVGVVSVVRVGCLVCLVGVVDGSIGWWWWGFGGEVLCGEAALDAELRAF